MVISDGWNNDCAHKHSHLKPQKADHCAKCLIMRDVANIKCVAVNTFDLIDALLPGHYNYYLCGGSDTTADQHMYKKRMEAKI